MKKNREISETRHRTTELKHHIHVTNYETNPRERSEASLHTRERRCERANERTNERARHSQRSVARRKGTTVALNGSAGAPKTKMERDAKKTEGKQRGCAHLREGEGATKPGKGRNEGTKERRKAAKLTGGTSTTTIRWRQLETQSTRRPCERERSLTGEQPFPPGTALHSSRTLLRLA